MNISVHSFKDSCINLYIFGLNLTYKINFKLKHFMDRFNETNTINFSKTCQTSHWY